MRRLAIVLAATAALLGFTRAAHADWYYTWVCEDGCDTYDVAEGLVGEAGGFDTYDACEAARTVDWRYDAWWEPGWLDVCQWREPVAPVAVEEPAAAPSHGSPVPLARLELGLLAGPPFRVADGVAMEDGTGYTTGLELRAIGGRRPEVGVALTLGLAYASLTTPRYGDAAKPMMFVPLTVGVAISPAIARGAREWRLDLGVDAGGLYRAGCSTCADEGLPTFSFLASARAGLAVYRGTTGLGLDAVYLYGNQGSVTDGDPMSIALVPPTVLVRLSLIARSQ